MSDNEDIECEIVNFYKKLYEEGEMLVQNDIDTTFFDLITPISCEEADEVSKPISVDELRKTLHLCKDSSPGAIFRLIKIKF